MPSPYAGIHAIHCWRRLAPLLNSQMKLARLIPPSVEHYLGSKSGRFLAVPPAFRHVVRSILADAIWPDCSEKSRTSTFFPRLPLWAQGPPNASCAAISISQQTIGECRYAAACYPLRPLWRWEVGAAAEEPASAPTARQRLVTCAALCGRAAEDATSRSGATTSLAQSAQVFAWHSESQSAHPQSRSSWRNAAGSTLIRNQLAKPRQKTGPMPSASRRTSSSKSRATSSRSIR